MACCVVETRMAHNNPVSINRQTAAECGKLFVANKPTVKLM